MHNTQAPPTEQQKNVKPPSPFAVNQFNPNPGSPGFAAANQFNPNPGQPGYPAANQFNVNPGQPQVQKVQPDSQSMYRQGNNANEEERGLVSVDGQFVERNFAESNIRRAFVRKVYTILTIQLIFTFGVISVFVFEPRVRNFVQTHSILFWISLGIWIGIFIALACSVQLRRSYPTNIIMLVIFTLATSYMFGTLSSMVRTEAVLCAVGFCAVACFIITLFSIYTKFDFTTWGVVLFCLLIVLLVIGLVAIFTKNEIMIYVYGGLGAVLFMAYLAYDTQMIMGGRSVEISPEEHIFAAIQLYIDILYIYMFVLMLFDYMPF